MRVSAKVDYALRAMLELAAAGGLVKGEQLATAQAIPQKFLEAILVDLRHAELVTSRRGVEGGYALGKPASEISLADVIRAVEGPIATVRGVARRRRVRRRRAGARPGLDRAPGRDARRARGDDARRPRGPQRSSTDPARRGADRYANVVWRVGLTYTI